MRTTITSDPLAGLSRDRLWTEADLAVLFGKRSIHEYLKRQGDFPSPVPLNMRGWRWRPMDVIAWIDRSSNRLRPA